jgi:hypothetical protein
LVAAARKKLRWRGDLNEIILAGAAGAHSVIEYRYDHGSTLRYGRVDVSEQAVRPFPAGARRAGQTGLRRSVHALLADLRGLRGRGRSASKDGNLRRLPDSDRKA